MSTRALAYPALLLVTGAACAPLHTTTRVDEKVVGSREVTSEPLAREAVVTASPSADALDVVVRERRTCEKHVEEEVTRRERKTRDVNDFVVISEWVLGLGGLGAGGFLIWDANQADTDEDRKFDPGVDRETGRSIGYGVTAAGTLLVLAAIVDSAKAVDKERTLAVAHRTKEGSTARVACGDAPAVGLAIALRVPRPGATPVLALLGASDASGKVRAAWSSVPAEAFTDPSPDARGELVVLAGGSPAAAASGAPTAAVIPLAAGRVIHANAAWAAATTLNTEAAYREFMTKFPGARDEEAAARANGLSGAATKDAYARALAAGDADGARKALELWKKADPGAVPGDAESTVTVLEAKAKVDASTVRLADAMTAAEAPSAGLRELKAAHEALAAAKAIPIERAVLKPAIKVVAMLDGRIGKRIIAAANAASLGDGLAQLDEAIATLPEVKAFADAAKKRRAVEAAKEAAAARAAAKEAKAQAAKDAAAAKAAEREAAAQAAKEAAAAKAAERETAAAEKQRAREEAARAAADAKAAKVAADAQAKQDKLAAAAQAKQAAAQAKQDKLAAAAMAGATASAQERAQPQFVEWKLDAKFAKDDVLARVPVPQGCAAAIAPFFAQPPSCPTCAPVTMSRVRMGCGAATLELTKHEQSVWSMCLGQTCAECRAMVTAALAPFGGKKGGAKIVRSCEGKK